MVLKGRRGIRGGLKPHLEDPYLTRKSYKEPTICPRCGLVYRHRRWQKMPEFDSNKAAQRHKCPACRKEEDHYVMGIVHISGDFFTPRRQEMVNMLRNEEKKILNHNPLERIMGIVDEDDGVRVETTSENLAVHLGRMLYSAYGGDVEYKFSEEQKLARVFWHREKKEER
jgi:NMD protein affecting ribosome stability and mRNA decay